MGQRSAVVGCALLALLSAPAQAHYLTEIDDIQSLMRCEVISMILEDTEKRETFDKLSLEKFAIVADHIEEHGREDYAYRLGIPLNEISEEDFQGLLKMMRTSGTFMDFRLNRDEIVMRYGVWPTPDTEQERLMMETAYIEHDCDNLMIVHGG